MGLLLPCPGAGLWLCGLRMLVQKHDRHAANALPWRVSPACTYPTESTEALCESGAL